MNLSIIKPLFLNKSSLRWGWYIIINFIIVVVITSSIVAPVVFVISKIGLTIQPDKPLTGWNSILGSIITLIALYAGFLLGSHLAQRWLRRKTLWDLGLTVNREGTNKLILGIGLGLILICISVIISWLMGYYKFIGFSWNFRQSDLLLPAYFMSIIASIQSPLIEEIVFRGFLFQTIDYRWGQRRALLVSSLLFGAAHITSLAELSWLVASFSTFLAGLLFIQAYLVNRSLWLPIGIHFGWIFGGRLLNDTGGTAERALLLVSKVEGSELLVSPSTGGIGLFELIGVGIVSIILWLLSIKNKSS